MGDVQLSVKDLATSFGKFKISDVSFDLKSGDVFGLVGNSGSGKSTLIKTLVGLKRKDKGSIHIVYDNHEQLPSKVVGFSPQDNSLYPFLTLKENIHLFGTLHGVSHHNIVEQEKNLLKTLGLENAIHKRINQLSGGMRKRADLAVAMIHNPSVLVLDEPFNGLDISLQNFIWNHIKKLSTKRWFLLKNLHSLLPDLFPLFF